MWLDVWLIVYILWTWCGWNKVLYVETSSAGCYIAKATDTHLTHLSGMMIRFCVKASPRKKKKVSKRWLLLLQRSVLGIFSFAMNQSLWFRVGVLEKKEKSASLNIERTTNYNKCLSENHLPNISYWIHVKMKPTFAVGAFPQHGFYLSFPFVCAINPWLNSWQFKAPNSVSHADNWHKCSTVEHFHHFP